jgi:hypothetical protein
LALFLLLVARKGGKSNIQHFSLCRWRQSCCKSWQTVLGSECAVDSQQCLLCPCTQHFSNLSHSIYFYCSEIEFIHLFMDDLLLIYLLWWY